MELYPTDTSIDSWSNIPRITWDFLRPMMEWKQSISSRRNRPRRKQWGRICIYKPSRSNIGSSNHRKALKQFWKLSIDHKNWGKPKNSIEDFFQKVSNTMATVRLTLTTIRFRLPKLRERWIILKLYRFIPIIFKNSSFKILKSSKLLFDVVIELTH